MPDEIVRANLISEKFIADFCALVAQGNYYITACHALGISRSTFWRYMHQGQLDDEEGRDTLFRKLFVGVRRADAAAEVYALQCLSGHFTRDARAAVMFLARRYPDRWSERKYVRVAVEREITSLMHELEVGLPPDAFALVVQVLASVEAAREADAGADELDED
jgi:hypothetical protein